MDEVKTILEKINKGSIKVNELTLYQDVYLGRLSYIIRTTDIDIIFSILYFLIIWR